MTSQMINQSLLFPYGTFSLESTVQEHYSSTHLYEDYPLPEVLPLHHPHLQSLEGVYPLQESLPPWWADFVAQVQPRLRPLLAPLSLGEFRNGCIEESRWRDWRKEISKEERAADWFPRSPKLGPLLEHTPWQTSFMDRGGKEMPEALDLVISFRPDYLLNMSNGQGWSSCQHLYDGSENQCLPANLYDVGVAVAMVVPRGTDIWEESEQYREGVVIARTTLRILNNPDGSSVVALCRTYSNDATSTLALVTTLIGMLEQRRLSWGIINHYGMRRLMSSSLEMGARWGQAEVKQVSLVSPTFAFPGSWEFPYVDGEVAFVYDHSGEVVDGWAWGKLQATVLLYTPVV